jgi:hypothetical protein
MRVAKWLPLLAIPLCPRANEVLKNLPADSWYRAQGTAMRPACASETQFPDVRGGSGCRMVMDAWSGAAYDPVGKRLLVWGGGHGDYYGNEIYAFDVETLKWERLTDPSPVAGLSQDPMADGTPISRHTYDGLAFITHANRFFGYGGSMAGNGYGTERTWTWDPSGKKWSDMQPAGNANRPTTNCCNFSGEYDPVSRKVYLRDPYWLCAYDYDHNSWEHVQERDHAWGPGKAVIDTRRRLYFTIGSGEFMAYDLAAGGDATAQWKATGDDSLTRGYGAGAAYDPKADAIVGWMGGGPYVLDLAGKAWSRKSGAGAPARQLENGTFGRLRYVPDDNVFILANGIDSDVYFYKHTQGAGASPLRPGPKAPRARHPSVILAGTGIRFQRQGKSADARGRFEAPLPEARIPPEPKGEKR